jgi:hypothetical protein
MAARIQLKTTAPYKERKSELSQTVEHTGRVSPKQVGTPDLSGSASAIPQPKRHTSPSVAIEDAKLEAYSARSSKRARSNSDRPFSLRNVPRSGSEADPRSQSKRPKRVEKDNPTPESCTGPPQSDAEATFTKDANLPNDTSTNISKSVVRNVNNTGIDNCEIALVDQTKPKLRLSLLRFLERKLDHAGVLREVIPPTKQLYAIGPHRESCGDLDLDFKNFNRALEHWESLITKHTATSGATQSPLGDPLQELAAQESFKDRVAMLRNCDPTSQTDFTLETWTISLALLFEGLLGDSYMPCSFADMVAGFRVSYQSLYEPLAQVSDSSCGERVSNI